MVMETSASILLCLLEVRLLTIGAISDGRHPYFPPTLVDRRYLVEDDHIPFLERSKSSVVEKSKSY